MLQEEIISTLQRENAEQQKRIAYLENELAQLKRLIFGKKSERFISAESPLPSNSLFSVEELPENKIENLTEVISHRREKPEIKKGGRKELPSHLVREITVIEPENKIEGDRLIGTLITEILEYTPGVLYVNRIERRKYVNDQDQALKIAAMPNRPIDKSQFGVGLMTHAIMQKYMDHIPLYRQLEQFKRLHQVDISKSSFGESVQQHIELLRPI